MDARMTDDPVELALIVELLRDEVVAGADQELFLRSVPAFITQSPPFRFFLVADGPTVENFGAAGIVTVMEVPFLEENVLAVDGLWLRFELAFVAEFALRQLLRFAEDHDLAALCFTRRSTNRPDFLASLLPQELDSQRPLLQAYVPGVYSAFADGPLGTGAFPAEMAALATITQEIDLAGAD